MKLRLIIGVLGILLLSYLVGLGMVTHYIMMGFGGYGAITSGLLTSASVAVVVATLSFPTIVKKQDETHTKKP